MILVSTQQPDGRPGTVYPSRSADGLAFVLPESLHTAHVARLQFFCDRLLKSFVSCVLVWLLPAYTPAKPERLRYVLNNYRVTRSRARRFGGLVAGFTELGCKMGRACGLVPP